MKKYVMLFMLLSSTQGFYAQVSGRQEITKAAAEAQVSNNLDEIKTRGIKYGVSLGFNKVFQKLVEARISPIDTTLKYQRNSGTAFVLSTSVSFALTKGRAAGRYYVALDAAGNPVGNPYYVPTGLAVIGSVNLATFNSALGGAGVFNAKLDGGIGLGYTFGDNVQAAITFEMISYRQPRNYLDEYENEKLKVNNHTATSIALDDNEYFVDKYMPSLSFKIIYLLNKE